MTTKKSGFDLRLRCIDNSGYPFSLTVGKIYKGEIIQFGALGVIDNTGDSYLFERRRFEVLQPDGSWKYFGKQRTEGFDMRVRCIDNTGHTRTLTVGKIYVAEDGRKDYIGVIGNTGKAYGYKRDLFEVLDPEEYKDVKPELNQLYIDPPADTRRPASASQPAASQSAQAAGEEEPKPNPPV